MKKFLLLLASLGLLTACSNDPDPEADKASFTRIFDNNKFNSAYSPLDIQQTPDGGYLILGSRNLEDTNFAGIYLLKADEFGNFVSEFEVPSDLVNPVGTLMKSGTSYYFFAMTPIGLQSQLVEVTADGQLGQIVEVGGSYPASSAMDGNNFLLLSYDHQDKESIVTTISPAGAIVQGPKGFSIGAGDAVEEPIINHFLKTGKQFPFRVGKSGNQYFFNGFYNYTFSLVFSDLSDAEPAVIQGNQDDGGFSEVQPLGGNIFAAARFNFGDNYILPRVTLNTTGISSSVDLGGNVMPELIANAPIKVIQMSVNSSERLIYGSTTEGRQIGLFAYDLATGEFLGSKYLGFSNAFEMSSMTPTSDGGLVVCGTTYMAGRFPRIVIFKLSPENLKEAFQ